MTSVLGHVTLPTGAEGAVTVMYEPAAVGADGFPDPQQMWGRSLVLDGPHSVCGTLVPLTGRLAVSVARLATPVAGTVMVMTWQPDAAAMADGQRMDARIVTDVYHVSGVGGGLASDHVWKLFVTEVLDSKAGMPCQAFRSAFRSGFD